MRLNVTICEKKSLLSEDFYFINDTIAEQIFMILCIAPQLVY